MPASVAAYISGTFTIVGLRLIRIATIVGVRLISIQRIFIIVTQAGRIEQVLVYVQNEDLVGHLLPALHLKYHTHIK